MKFNLGDLINKVTPIITNDEISYFWETSNRIRESIIISRRLWPDFSIDNDCIFLADSSKENIDLARKLCTNRIDIEYYVNHRHIIDLFGGYNCATTKEEINYLGTLVQYMLTAKLQYDFPSISFQVVFNYNGNQDEANVTFWQI